MHPVIQDKFFNCSLYEYIERAGLNSLDPLPNRTKIDLDTDKMIFVTAASSNHFELVRGLVQNLRRFHPVNQVVFYDLGLSETEVSLSFFKIHLADL